MTASPCVAAELLESFWLTLSTYQLEKVDSKGMLTLSDLRLEGVSSILSDTDGIYRAYF
jgi:hypothetical protein